MGRLLPCLVLLLASWPQPRPAASYQNSPTARLCHSGATQAERAWDLRGSPRLGFMMLSEGCSRLRGGEERATMQQGLPPGGEYEALAGQEFATGEAQSEEIKNATHALESIEEKPIVVRQAAKAPAVSSPAQNWGRDSWNPSTARTQVPPVPFAQPAVPKEPPPSYFSVMMPPAAFGARVPSRRSLLAISGKESFGGQPQAAQAGSPFSGPGVGNWQQSPPIPAPPPFSGEPPPEYNKEDIKKRAETDPRSMYTGACESMPHSIAERAMPPSPPLDLRTTPAGFGRKGSYGVIRTTSYSRGLGRLDHSHMERRKYEQRNAMTDQLIHIPRTREFGRYIYFTGGQWLDLPFPRPFFAPRNREDYKTLKSLYLDRVNPSRDPEGRQKYNGQARRETYRIDKFQDKITFNKLKNMTEMRSYHASSSWHGRCVVAGGLNENFTLLDTVEWHQPEKGAEGNWTNLGKLWGPRMHHSLVELDSQLYCIGGVDHECRLITWIERYDPTMNHWRQEVGLNVHRTGIACCALNGRIYAAGGLEDIHPLKNKFIMPRIQEFSLTNICEAFDPVLKEWNFVAPMHVKRTQASCCAWKGLMWVAGGYTMEREYIQTVESYDPKTNQWTVRGDLPVPMAEFPLVVLPTSKGESLCTLGGLYDQDDDIKYSTSSIFRYNLETEMWEAMLDLTLPDGLPVWASAAAQV